MSELINSRDTRAAIRWNLLTGASALALTAYISSVDIARAGDSSRPLVWIELGGQFDALTDPSETWVPENLQPPIDHPVAGILSQIPHIGYDANGKITFRPADSAWNFSVSIQYGNAKRGPKSGHDQTYKTHYKNGLDAPTTYAFADTSSVAETSHTIVDFQAGKDLGLGLFGSHGSSSVNFGIRVAQFNERQDGMMTAQISLPAKYAAIFGDGAAFDAYMHSTRSFSGIGPSIAWNGSVPLAGSLTDGIAFDWGAAAAFLFGRQKTKVRTHTEEEGFSGITNVQTSHGSAGYLVTHVLTHSTQTSIRKKQVTVPNIGGFAGISYRLNGDAKLSLGYRADFFFGAIDGGIDARKSENVGFYGPFAAISVGIGG